MLRGVPMHYSRVIRLVHAERVMKIQEIVVHRGPLPNHSEMFDVVVNFTKVLEMFIGLVEYGHNVLTS